MTTTLSFTGCVLADSETAISIPEGVTLQANNTIFRNNNKTVEVRSLSQDILDRMDGQQRIEYFKIIHSSASTQQKASLLQRFFNKISLNVDIGDIGKILADISGLKFGAG